MAFRASPPGWDDAVVVRAITDEIKRELGDVWNITGRVWVERVPDCRGPVVRVDMMSPDTGRRTRASAFLNQTDRPSVREELGGMIDEVVADIRAGLAPV